MLSVSSRRTAPLQRVVATTAATPPTTVESRRFRAPASAPSLAILGHVGVRRTRQPVEPRLRVAVGPTFKRAMSRKPQRKASGDQPTRPERARRRDCAVPVAVATRCHDRDQGPSRRTNVRASTRRWQGSPSRATTRRSRTRGSCVTVAFGNPRPATFCAPSTPEVSSLVLPSGPIRPWAADAHGRMSAGPASRSRCCNRVRWRRRRFRRHTSRSGRRRPGSRRCCHPAARSRARHRTRRRCRLRR